MSRTRFWLAITGTTLLMCTAVFSCWQLVLHPEKYAETIHDASVTHKPFQHTDESFRQEWESMDDDLDDAPESTIRTHAAKGLPSPKLYPPADISVLATKDKWRRPRGLVEGKILMERTEGDGDHHVVIEDDKGNKLVLEEIPEYPLKNGRPKVGDSIYAWFIYRWDGVHSWGEGHPWIGWKEK